MYTSLNDKKTVKEISLNVSVCTGLYMYVYALNAQNCSESANQDNYLAVVLGTFLSTKKNLQLLFYVGTWLLGGYI